MEVRSGFHGGLELDDEAAALLALALQAPRATWPPAVAGLANLLVVRGEEAASRIRARQRAPSSEAPTLPPAGGDSGPERRGALLSVHEAAERSGLGAGRIRELLRSGRLAGHKAGPRTWLVEVTSLDAWARVHAAEVA